MNWRTISNKYINNVIWDCHCPFCQYALEVIICSHVIIMYYVNQKYCRGSWRRGTIVYKYFQIYWWFKQSISNFWNTFANVDNLSYNYSRDTNEKSVLCQFLFSSQQKHFHDMWLYAFVHQWERYHVIWR